MKTLHLLTNKSRFDSLSLVCRQSDFAKFAISLVLFLCLGIGQMWGNEYNIVGDCTDWASSPMTVSTGENYEYFGPTTTQYNSFHVVLVADGSEYGASCVQDGFNTTDVAITTYSTDACVNNALSQTYYIIVWYPNTDFNANNYPVICASTTLPDDTSSPSGDEVLYSATCIVASNVSIAAKTTNQAITAAQATITGGTLSITNKHNSAYDLLRPNIGPSGNQKSAFYLNGNKEYFTVVLTSPKVLQVGDVISAQIRLSSSDVGAGTGLWFTRSTTTTRPGSAPTEKAVTTTTDGKWYSVSYTVAAGDNLVGQSSFNIYRGTEKSTAFTDFVITRPFVCTAPNHVDVSGTNKYLGGQEIRLTATAYSTAGTGSPIAAGNITGYQWQKEINSVWTNVTNGTTDGVTISGATTNILQITPCTHQNSGQYRCIISTGATCSTTSDAYGVHVFSIYGHYYGGEYAHNEITWTSGTTGTATIHLNASSTYLFKVWSNDGYYYGNGANNYIIQPINWDCGTGNSEMRLLTGPEGDYTFTVNIEHGLDGSPYVNLQVAYPSVSHPSTGYMYITKWWGTCYVHYWEGTNNDLSPWGYDPALNSDRYVEICGTNYWYFPVIDTYNKVIAKDAAGDPSNTTGDQVSTDHGGKYITHDGSWGWHDFTTYTISFNAGGGSGTMSSITGICPNDNQAIPANSFTKSAYTFANWTADVDVRVGGATVTAGSPIAGGATIQSINSDITLTAQWTIDPSIVEIPGTVDKSPAPTFGNSATWWTANTDYIDLFKDITDGYPSAYADWNVYLSHPGIYAVSETGHYENGHQYRIELWDGGSLVASYETTATWDASTTEDLTFDQGATWDLSALSAGLYTLRVKAIMQWGEPKLKSITLSYCIPKVPNQTLYGDEGDAMRAYGTITDAVVTALDHTPSGAISVSGRTLTIGSETFTAPETAAGTLTNIPKDCYPECSYVSSCVWRFKEWNTAELKAVYIPTFEIGYNTNGGTINDDPYATWYEYTGREEDITELPMNVTKDGYLFAGWYQDESTKELFPYITGNYYGNYSGEWCLRAHWVLPCEEQRVITGVTLTSSSTYTTDGYDEEYIGTPLVTITGSGSANANVDGVSGDETGYELGAAGDMVFVTLGVGEFRVGDIVNVYITARNTVGRSGGSDAYLELFYKTEGGDIIRLTHLKNVSSAGKYSYTLPSDDVSDMTEAGAVSLGVYRKDGADGQNPYVYRVEVVGCRDLFFDDNNNTHVWNDPKNWAPTYHEIPSYYQATHILKPCTVNIANAQAKYIELEKDAVKGHDGKLTINANAALAVEETMKEARGESLYAVQASDLVILANSSNQGALVLGDALGTTHATVQFYARGGGAKRGDLSAATWQYMGVPFSDVSNAQSHYYDGWMCQWIENTVGNAGSNWKWIVNGNPLYPFTGYCLTQNAAKTYTNTGTLVPSTNRDLTVTYTTGEGYGYFGWNMFANSYMAPINIAAFEDGDFEGEIEKTIYLFNTGISDGTTAAQGEGAGAGQYVTIPVSSAGSMLPANQYIAPMQGFYILATAAGTHTVTLNYDRLVRKADHSALSVGPNRAKKEDDEPSMARIIIDVKGVHFSDRLYVFENAEQTNGFDNGWDGWKFEGEAYAPQLMTRTGDLDLAVDVSPAFGGKRIAFRVGEDSEYTLHFSTTEEGLYLRDLSNDMETEITEGGTYTFMAFNTTTEERFEIIDRRNEIPDGIEEVVNNATYDILDMTVYTAEGRLVLHRTTDFNKPLNLSTGMYVIYLNTTAGTQVHKIIF